jgi:hypothetical protein
MPAPCEQRDCQYNWYSEEVRVIGHIPKTRIRKNHSEFVHEPFPCILSALQNWTGPLNRIEKLSFADGTALSLADESALAAWRVPSRRRRHRGPAILLNAIVASKDCLRILPLWQVAPAGRRAA